MISKYDRNIKTIEPVKDYVKIIEDCVQATGVNYKELSNRRL